MGADETFGRDTDDREVVLRELLRLSAKVGRPDAGRAGGRPDGDAEGAVRRLHHDHPVPDPGEATDVTQEVYRTAADLFDRARPAAGPDPAGRRPGRGAGAPGHGAATAGAGGAGPRLVGGRRGRRPGDAQVRGRGGPAGHPDRDRPALVPADGVAGAGRRPRTWQRPRVRGGTGAAGGRSSGGRWSGSADGRGAAVPRWSCLLRRSISQERAVGASSHEEHRRTKGSHLIARTDYFCRTFRPNTPHPASENQPITAHGGQQR